MRSSVGRPGNAPALPAADQHGKIWEPFQGSHVVFYVLGLVFVMLWSTACADFHRGTPADASPGMVDDPVFENDVYPILLSTCIFCHSPGNEAQGTRLVISGDAKADRAMVVKLVTPSNPDSSLLLQKAIGNSHFGGTRLIVDTPDYITVRDWIASLATGP
jgi:hypothetical protein